MSEQVVQAARALSGWEWGRDDFVPSDMSMSTSTPGELTEVASFQAKNVRTLAFDQPADLHLPAHETFETNGTADDTETFNVDHDLRDVSGVANSLVLFNEGTRVQPDSVDYAGNSFDYTDSGTSNTLDVFYMAGDQAKVEVRIDAPRNHHEIIETRDIGVLNMREQTRDPVTLDADHPLEGVIPTDWRLRVLVDAPYEVAYENPDTGAQATNFLLRLPAFVANYSDVEGLESARKTAIQ